MTLCENLVFGKCSRELDQIIQYAWNDTDKFHFIFSVRFSINIRQTLVHLNLH